MGKSLTTTELDCEDLSTTPKLIERILDLEVTKEESFLEEVKKTLDGLVLKELSKGLKYAFLGRMRQSRWLFLLNWTMIWKLNC